MSKDQSAGGKNESTAYTSGDLSVPPELRFVHYNDVYHIDPSSAEPAGGVARFQTLCNYYRNDPAFTKQPGLLTFFSGDAFNPSLESSVTKGSHMVPFLNSIGTDVACVGNHDLDFGVPRFQDLAKKCSFPWLLANVLDPGLGDDIPLGNAKKTVILTASNGIKVGVIGLVEREWLDTINTLPPNLIYKSASQTAIELIPVLRQQGADFIIALTHQREPNDIKLAENTPNGLIDMILGGHDHYYKHDIVNGTHLLRSGTDFKQLSYIEARRQVGGTGWDLNIMRRDITSDIIQDPTALRLTESLTNKLKSKLEKPLGYTVVPLDARFTTVRMKESNVGNLVCDLMRSYYDGDCCIMAAGTIRGDQIYPPGILRVKDIMNCFPFEDPCVVIKISGQAVLEALENSVSTYPALEGRFPQVSNIEFEFDAARPSHSRILWVRVGGESLQPDKQYKVVTRDYMARGKDGFISMLYKSDGGNAEEIVSEENGILISMLLRQYFMSLKVLCRWKHWSPHMDDRWSGLHHEMHQKESLLKPEKASNDHKLVKSIAQDPTNQDSHDDSDSDSPEAEHETALATAKEHETRLIRKFARRWWNQTNLTGHPGLSDRIDKEDLEIDWTKAVAPRVEGRIRIRTAVAAC